MSFLRNHLPLTAGLIAVAGVGLAGLSAIRNAADQRILIRSGNDVYWEFREFLRETKDVGGPLWVDCCTGITNHSSSAVLPIYTKSWSGLSDVWPGELRVFDARRSGSFGQPGPEAITAGLVAFDQTRSPKGVLPPSALADSLGVDWATAWISPTPHAGRIVVFDAGRTRSKSLLSEPVALPALTDEAWRAGGVNTPVAQSPIDGEDGGAARTLYRIDGTATDRTELLRAEMETPLAPGEYTLRFALVPPDAGTFAMVRIDTQGVGEDQRVRHDVRVGRLDGELSARPSNMLGASVEMETADRAVVEASFLITAPVERFSLAIYPSAGTDFPRFDKAATGSLLIAQPEIILRRAAP